VWRIGFGSYLELVVGSGLQVAGRASNEKEVLRAFAHTFGTTHIWEISGASSPNIAPLRNITRLNLQKP
jgi:hypothetical protein